MAALLSVGYRRWPALTLVAVSALALLSRKQPL